MRRIKYLVALLFIVSHTAFAQQQGWQIGVKVLPEFTKINNIPEESYRTEAKFVVNGGISVLKNVNSVLSVESGLYYKNRGNVFNFTVFNDPISVTSSYKYLSVPLLARASFRNTFYASLGPTVDFFLGASTDKAVFVRPSVDDNSTRVGLGWQAGLGFQRSITKQWAISAELQANPMFTNVYQDADWKNFSCGGGFSILYLL